ncbi:cytochrome C [Photobacterium lipolyticum]|uniref:Cytochrome C n=2 Tax=Photobacterium lipolyticum TaxID=266810 RepID=A0A2T3N532_9GAMM|nr:cytochrome C [Photobacterium lipolyticum]
MIVVVAPLLMADDNFSPYFDGQGNISLPPEFRTSMVHLGSWFVPKGDASGFHDVYTEKATVEAYRKFPDGATLVKELRTAKTGNYTTGRDISYATDGLKQWFVMVKDTKGRFTDNPLWGDVWGWALYKPDAPTKNVATDYKVDCLGCHIPAKSTDLVYEEAYPTLDAD